MKDLTKPLYVSSQKDRNENKYGIISGKQCICCSTPMGEKESLSVHMNTNWEAVNPKIVTEQNCLELTGYESQGSFDIGNSCALQMKGFTF